MLQANTKAHALGVSRAGNGTRIWLEGKRLANHGFSHGVQCVRIWSQGQLILRPCDSVTFDSLERNERTTIAGSPARPIVDITGETVAQAFPSGNVLVAFEQGRITIRGI